MPGKSYRRTIRIKVAGQAEIWLATESPTEAVRVMKRLLPTAQLNDPDAELQRFHREVRSQGSLKHPHIMPILGWNFTVSPPWYVMPRAEQSLEDLLKVHPSGLAEDQALSIIEVVAEAVEYAHSEGILHRDLKPGNILQLDDAWVVADFGLCRDLASDSVTITKTHAVVGTVAYLAPEQYDDAHQVGPASDIFSLGRMLFHMLTGQVPFPYCRLELLPAKFRYLVSRCLTEEPVGRYQTVAEFRRELGMLAYGSDDLASPMQRAKRLLQEALGGNTAAASQLAQLLLENSDDEVFYRDVVGHLPAPVLATLQVQNGAAFIQVVRNYAHYSEGSHPFSYTDVIADFFASVFRISADTGQRELSLEVLLRVGYEHSRFYIRNQFLTLLSGLSDPQDVLLAAKVLRSHPAAARWMNETSSVFSYPRAIKEALAA